MSPQQYILKEKRLMERECRRRGISYSQWIAKYAHAYHEKYAGKVAGYHFARCFSDCI